MRRLITRFSRSAALRRAVQVLRLHKLGNAWLRAFPRVKKLPRLRRRLSRHAPGKHPAGGGDVRERQPLQRRAAAARLHHLCRSGCNVGYFTCWLAHLAAGPAPRRSADDGDAPSGFGHAGGRKLRGLMLDANPDAVKEAQWHAQANALPDGLGLHGIAGEGKPGDFAEFYLYESNICSTSHLPDVEKMALKGKWEKIRVPSDLPGEVLATSETATRTDSPGPRQRFNHLRAQ